jgi:hypothetical protein
MNNQEAVYLDPGGKNVRCEHGVDDHGRLQETARD